MKKKLLYLSIMVLSAVALIYSCSNNSAVKPALMGATASVSIQNFAFVPDTIMIKTGGTVTWTNQDSAPHTVTDLNSSFNSSNLATSQTFMFTFTTPGTFTYHCLVHPMMKNAVVIVSN